MARKADGMDGHQRSLTELEPVKESAKAKTSRFGSVDQGWNGMRDDETMHMLIEYEDPADEQLFRCQAVGGDHRRPETHVVRGCPVVSPAFSRKIIFQISTCYLSYVVRTGSAGRMALRTMPRCCPTRLRSRVS